MKTINGASRVHSLVDTELKRWLEDNNYTMREALELGASMLKGNYSNPKKQLERYEREFEKHMAQVDYYSNQIKVLKADMSVKKNKKQKENDLLNESLIVLRDNRNANSVLESHFQFLKSNGWSGTITDLKILAWGVES